MFSIVILAMISPLLVAIALGVKLSSAGPILFKQRRDTLPGPLRSVNCATQV